MREFVINTMSVTVWHVQEFDSTELNSKSLGHFHSGDSYIIRWIYNVSIQGINYWYTFMYYSIIIVYIYDNMIIF